MSPPSGSSRTSSENSDAGEALLHTGTRKQEEKNTWQNWSILGLGVWAVFATAGAIFFSVLWQHSAGKHAPSLKFPPSGKRNVIFMVSDGMGPTSLALTRSFRQLTEDLNWDNTLILDKHLIGTSRTRSTNSLVTDSAAGATAFSCGIKSYNGAISVLPDGSPCGTVLEAAKKAGYMTGLVVTTRLTDATPACFSAHVNMRTEEDRIAEQQLGDYPLGLVVDLMLGGGRCHFLPNTTTGSCRGDSRDLVSEAKKKHGFSYVDSREGFDSLKNGKNVKLPILGLFAKTDIPYEIDRVKQNDIYPALWEMATTAIKALEDATKDSDKGFFLMVEGSRIDHAGHGNDPAAQVHEVLAYDKTFGKIMEFVDSSKTQTVVVSTSDHETGGLAVARQLHAAYPEYLWYPQVLANATSSSEFLDAKYATYTGERETEFLKNEILKKGLGISDASKSELKALRASKGASAWVLADMISRRAQVGWSTHGHSGVDVNIYGSAGTERLHGNRENTDVGGFIRDYLELDLEGTTRELKQKGVGSVRSKAAHHHHDHDDDDDDDEKYPWMGRSLEELKGEDWKVEGVDCYHGDYRKHKH